MPYNPLKDKIFVAIGDPTIEKRMVSNEAVAALKKAVDNHTFDGYNSPYDPSDVIMGSGGSDALKLILTSLADEGDNVLLSKPDFDYYKNMVLNPHKIQYHEYVIDLEKREINLSSVEHQINSRTKAILLTNPHNPTGISFSKENLEGLLAIAEKYKLPIISDEIYQKVVYNAPFYPLAQLNPKVPIVVCDGLSKRVHVPGWRLGWSVIYDSYEILGPSALVQGALPDILNNTPQSYYDNIKHKIRANVDMVYNKLSAVHGLKPYKPDGAMYMLIRVDEKVTGVNDTQFCRSLIKEQSLYLLPGVFFSAPGHIRMLVSRTYYETEEAVLRLTEYMQKFHTNNSKK
uniref:Aminotransferase class I/classII domain-containing protein n=1 Tax=Ditylenchus dipsaci TaxID=166011 RepID=A0A915D5W5_9BILA